MKKSFTVPRAEIIKLELRDIMNTSGDGSAFENQLSVWDNSMASGLEDN